MTPTPGASASQPSTVASRSASNPVVPTTAWMPWPMQNSRLSITASGWVKSTTASAPESTSDCSRSSTSTAATSSRSPAASTARHTSLPTLPCAPSTPTRRTNVTSQEPTGRPLTCDERTWQGDPMAVQTIPARIRWAVDFMDVRPNDHILEIGCGPGAGAELMCARLQTGKVFAIDRSESGVDRTRRRCAKFIEAGRLTVRQIDLATLRVPVKRLTKVFAFNVNLFWVRDCADEVALLHERVLPGGSVFLFFDATRPEEVPTIVEKSSAVLQDAGFRVSVVEQKAPAVVGIIGKR